MKLVRKKKERKTFLQWCEERSIKDGLHLGGIDVVFSVCFALICYFLAMYFIGNGAYNYNDKVYEKLQIATGTSLTEDFGLDEKALRAQVKEYSLTYKDGQSTIVTRETIGHFVAEVTVELSEDKLKNVKIENIPEEYLSKDLSEESSKTYYSIPSSRNYNSREDYLIRHYVEVACWILAGPVVYIIVFRLLLNCILFVIAKRYVKFYQMRNAKIDKITLSKS